MDFFLKECNSDEISLALKKCICMRSLALGASENKYSSYFYSFRGTNNYFMELPLSNSWSSTKMEGLNHSFLNLNIGPRPSTNFFF